jgi:hypothetical protein
MDQQLRDRVDYKTGLEETYRTRGDRVVDPWLAGEGGYTPAQAAAIADEPGVSGLTLTDEERRLAHLSPEERAAIMGDPDRASQFLRPQYTSDLHAAGTDLTRAAGQRQRGLYDEGIQRGVEGYDKAIDPERLRMDPAYAAAVAEAGGTGVAATQEAVDDPALDLSPEYLRDRGWSDADIAKLKGVAAQRGMANYRSASSDLERRAAMQGNVSPLALAEARRRFEREGAVQSADAAAYAEMLGETERRKATQAMEDTRLGAADVRTGHKVRGAQQAYDIGSGAARDVEKTRLGSEQFLTEAELQAQQDLLDARLQKARITGQSDIDIEQSARDTGVELAERQEERNIDVFGDAEAATALRAADIAANRQKTDQSIIDTDLQTELDQTDRRSERAGKVADLAQDRITQGVEYTMGQQGAAQSAVEKAQDQRLQSQGLTQQGELGGATGQAQVREAKDRGSFGRAFRTGLGSGLSGAITGGITGAFKNEGGLITKPTLAIVGEAGPERITPVSLTSPDTAALSAESPTLQPPAQIPTPSTPSDNLSLPITTVVSNAQSKPKRKPRSRRSPTLPFVMRPETNPSDLGGDGRAVSAGPLY